MNDLTELYRRVNSLEKEHHTLRYRIDNLENEKLPQRVANLEPAMRQVQVDVSKIEATAAEIEKQLNDTVLKLETAITSIRSMMKGFMACLGGGFLLFQVLIPLLMEYSK